MDDKIVKVKFVPHECPVCNGFGTLRHGTKTCQACKGSGLVVINDDTGETVPSEGGENVGLD